MNTTTKKAANSIVGKLTAVILAGAAAVLLTGGGSATAQGSGANVLVVGDSLQVGTGPYLEQQLGAVPVEFDHQQSRGSGVGLSILRSRLSPEHSVVIFDLGTNDDPGNPDALIATMRAARQASGDRCLIVATILRPPYNGVSVDGMNAAIQGFAAETPNVVLVDWYGVATSTPKLLYSDGVHARPEGYALRGRLLADGVAQCEGGGSRATTGIPAPRGNAERPPPIPHWEPQPAPERDLQVEAPAPLVAIGSAVRGAAALVAAAGRDARQAAGMGPPEPVLGAE